MIKLLIDTASSRIVLGLYQDDTILKEIKEENDHQLSVRIFPLLDQLFQETKISPKEVDEIVVVTGPGSFTGVRIGVTIAKTYAWSFNKKIITVSELQCMASTEVDTDYCIPMIDARRNAVYAGIYDRNLDAVIPDQYITLDALQKKVEELDGTYTFISDQTFPSINVIKPNMNLKVILKKHENDEGINPHQVNPNYLKKTEAEENLTK